MLKCTETATSFLLNKIFIMSFISIQPPLFAVMV